MKDVVSNEQLCCFRKINGKGALKCASVKDCETHIGPVQVRGTARAQQCNKKTFCHHRAIWCHVADAVKDSKTLAATHRMLVRMTTMVMIWKSTLLSSNGNYTYIYIAQRDAAVRGTTLLLAMTGPTRQIIDPMDATVIVLVIANVRVKKWLCF